MVSRIRRHSGNKVLYQGVTPHPRSKPHPACSVCDSLVLPRSTKLDGHRRGTVYCGDIFGGDLQPVKQNPPLACRYHPLSPDVKQGALVTLPVQQCCQCTCVDSDFECGIAGFSCLDPSATELYDCEEPPTGSPCSLEAQQAWVVEDSAQAQAVAANVNCSGESFQVKWRGSVSLDAPIFIMHGTDLNVTGGGEASAVIDGNGNTRLFSVDNATLRLSGVELCSGFSTGGGAIAASGATLAFRNTSFVNDSAGTNGGALWWSDSSASRGGGTGFISNTATESGGVIFLLNGSYVSSTGDTKVVRNGALVDGGAVGSVASDSVLSPEDSTLSIDGPTAFVNNTSGENGGALALLGELSISVNTEESSFVDNSADLAGGTVYVSDTAIGPTFSDVIFDSNFAHVGGALLPTTFSRCRFTYNRETATGGAVDSASGQDLFEDTVFRGNQAVTGGALRLAGRASLENCSFVENLSDEGEGAAVSNVGIISEISNTSFSGNVFNCAPDTFLNYTVRDTMLTCSLSTMSGDPLDEACSGCQATCDGCAQPPAVPLCSDVIPDSRSDGGLVTLETLLIDPGYWMATNSSTEVLACYNVDACVGGITGATEYCVEGYEGPYCAICSDDYSVQLGFTCSKCPDRAGGILLATALAVIGLFTVAAVVSYVAWRVGAESEGGVSLMCGTALLSPPSKKTIALLHAACSASMRFTSAANVTYPAVYQRFLNALDVFNFEISWIISAGCVMDLDFHDLLLLSTIGPLIALLFLAATYRAGSRINRGNTEALQLVWDRHVSMVLLLVLLRATSSTAAGNTCARIEYDSSNHQGFRVYAGFMILLYPVGIPAFYGALLFRDRDVLQKDPDGREDPPRISSISNLWQPYRPS
ncbi:unnamed protein product [Ectocarpus sp. CCAP 1310/34]|nr:unnamed protein product [Ectocarpus sp. CCAP 1310/34]